MHTWIANVFTHKYNQEIQRWAIWEFLALLKELYLYSCHYIRRLFIALSGMVYNVEILKSHLEYYPEIRLQHCRPHPKSGITKDIFAIVMAQGTWLCNILQISPDSRVHLGISWNIRAGYLDSVSQAWGCCSNTTGREWSWWWQAKPNSTQPNAILSYTHQQVEGQNWSQFSITVLRSTVEAAFKLFRRCHNPVEPWVIDQSWRHLPWVMTLLLLKSATLINILLAIFSKQRNQTWQEARYKWRDAKELGWDAGWKGCINTQNQLILQNILHSP